MSMHTIQKMVGRRVFFNFYGRVHDNGNLTLGLNRKMGACYFHGACKKDFLTFFLKIYKHFFMLFSLTRLSSSDKILLRLQLCHDTMS